MQFVRGRRVRLIVLGCVALALGTMGASVAARQSSGASLDSLTQRLDEIAREKERVREKLRGVKQRQRRVSRQLADLDGRLNRAEVRLDRVVQSASRTESELARAVREYKAAEGRLAGHRGSVGDRLVAIYQRGEVRPIEVLLQSASFADFANRLYLLNHVIARDAQLLEEFETARAEADARRCELNERAQSLARLREKIATERRRTSAERNLTERKKRDLLRDRAAWERALAELEEDSREIEAMLQRLQQTPEGQARLAKPWTGELQWPLKGRITSPFGYRRHPIYRVRKMHTGIDIAAPSGTAIRAAGAGEVVHAGRWGGYGKCVIIDHSGGVATLYAHCSSLAVTKGQAVREGQVIANVGSTGLSTGPHLHFEVRRGGRPVDPMSLLD
jgi:murein DD-endopeptidase MepM/ murein hydrolase activator NlpD